MVSEWISPMFVSEFELYDVLRLVNAVASVRFMLIGIAKDL